jgi:hypothetical protein
MQAAPTPQRIEESPTTKTMTSFFDDGPRPLAHSKKLF